MAEQEENYDDIIHLEHPTSRKHPRMSTYNRAAQFSPFAALTGHEEAMKETARLTDVKVELDEDAKVKLDKKMQIIREHIDETPEVTITYFQPDGQKEGGRYISIVGYVKKMDFIKRVIIMTDKQEIQVEDINEIESELFRGFDLF